MKRNSAYRLSSHGFLLVEHLFAIIVTSILMIVLLSFIHLMKAYVSNYDLISQNQIDALTTQLQIEAKIATRFATSNQKELDVYLYDGSLVTYRIQNQRLMRQVQGKGGEVALYHCQGLDVELLNDSAVYLNLQTPGKNYRFYLTIISLPIPIILEVEEEAIDENIIDVLDSGEVIEDSDNEILDNNEEYLEDEKFEEIENPSDSNLSDDELLDSPTLESDSIPDNPLEEVEHLVDE